MTLARNPATILALCGIAALACGDSAEPNREASTRIAFQSTRATGYPGIFLMDADGSNVQLVLADAGLSHTSPSLSPDGSRIAFESDRDGTTGIYVIGADGSGLTRITTGTSSEARAAWSPDGSRIVFERNGGIFTMNRDGTGVELVRSSGREPAWSPDGSRIVFADFAANDVDESLFLINPDGTGLQEIVSMPGSVGDPAWSPNGTRIAFGGVGPDNQEIYVVNADGTNLVNITNTPAPLGEIQPAWSPDGRSIVFTGFRNGNQEIVRRRVDGTGEVVLTSLGARDMHPSWSTRP